ncbi:dihydrodipicolinate synthase family protein [Paenibacillus cymbidii]|uniref:dihydrodipicolinate synthase family protein n=1 Tax=Paenibacillus cymbidii TaxID=1639034 RepID=UPI001081A638|nr:dihydrodipicolinate synthase family protein [Paenibacillus cymbidii]
MAETNGSIADGVWPTMVTPFADNGEIDYGGLEHLIEWYIGQGVNGLFAVCQSSEMFYLSLEERVRLAAFVVERSRGRVPVIASGHVSDRAEDQIEEIKRIAATGIEAFVLVSNRLAAADQPEELWKERAEAILRQVPDVSFGIYECPYPYKRLLSPELLRWCADTGRFLFLKDTCCDASQIAAKLDAVRGSRLKLFNANAATLLESLALGASGFSGVMANFHADLYVSMLALREREPERAARLQNFLGLASAIERQYYPVNAKFHLQLEGVPIGLNSRTAKPEGLTVAMREEIRQLRATAQWVRETV